MAISDTSSITGQNAASAVGGNSSTSNVDSEQRFLKLLVTQLNNQDPLNPMQNAELTSQLAQMSTVSGIEKLNSTLSGLVNQTGSNQLLQATSLIGQNVLSPGDVLATIYRHLGIDASQLTIPDFSGRPQFILPRGTPIRELVG